MTPNRENLQKLHDALGREAYFTMEIWTDGPTRTKKDGRTPKDCGTAACIGGTAEILMLADGYVDVRQSDVAKWLGIPVYTGEETFYPDMRKGGYEAVTLEDARKVVLNLMEYGKPRWNEVRPDLTEDAVR